jgi:hypothetical protein
MKNSSLFKSKEFQTPADKTQETELKGKTMVGLNSLWTFFISFTLLWSCVPQTKQTECASNEAFNASLRSCVPVVGGPTSFIKIDNFSPALPISVHKNDSTVIPLTITIDNPYAQSYTIEWERIYYGATTFYGGDTTTTSFIPLSFASELGPHFITAKIIAEGEVVDSHTFQINVSESPRPVVNSSTVTPASYALTLTPLDSPQEFSFKVKNNNAIISGAGYTTTWTLIKDGVVLQTESDSFTNTSTNGTNTFYFGTSVSSGFEFVPQDLGVGSYTLRAIVANTTPGEIVGEVQWSITLKHPDKSKIQTRHIFEGSTSPSYATTIVAYNGVPYTTDTTYNFIPTGQTNQGDFCVEIEDGDGTYPEDFEEEVYGAGNAEYVRVDFYLDNTTLIYTTYTTAIDETVCLSDAASAILDTVLFTNTTTTSSQAHTLVARVFDERTNSEYTNTDLKSGLGTYPITWNFNVKPVNAAPTVTFTSSSNLENITCTSTVGYTKNCNVTQDESFLVGINAVDEFYTTSSTVDSHQNQFAYTMTLYRNGNVIDTCTKLSSDDSDTNIDDVGDAGVDFIGPDYLCEFNVPSFDSSGSIDPEGEDYSIAIVFQDMGSPLTGSSPAISQTLYYNLTVTEANTAPVINDFATDTASPNSYVIVSGSPDPLSVDNDSSEVAIEGDTVLFNVRISDDERDDHQIIIYRCADQTSSCSSPIEIGRTTVNMTDNSDPNLATLLWTIPEDLVPVGQDITIPYQTYYKITVEDQPDNVSSLSSSDIVDFYVLNRNPAPYFSGTPNPTPDDPLTAGDEAELKYVFAGLPFSVDPGTVTDASIPSSENTIQYQWYVDTDNTDTYSAISGADSRVLIWTPSFGLSSDETNPTKIKLCVWDGTDINSLPDDGDVDTTNPITTNDQNGFSNCLGPWKVVVNSNMAQLNNGSETALALDSGVAIWFDNVDSSIDPINPEIGPHVIFSAYSQGSNLHIDKTVIDTQGKIYSNNTTGFKTLDIPALDGDAVSGTISDISITGNATHLYVAYKATLSTHSYFNSIAVLRIDKRSGEISGTEYGSRPTSTSTFTTQPYPHPGKFGFNYDFPFDTEQDDEISTPDMITSSTTNRGNYVEIEIDGSELQFAAGIDEFQLDNLWTDFVITTTNDCDDLLLCNSFNDENEAAERLAGIFNGNDNRAFQGFTATFDDNVVTVYGALGSDYIYSHPTDSTTNVGNGFSSSALKLGQIMIATDSNGSVEKWFLPFIDSSTSGSKIKVLYDVTSQPLTAANVASFDLLKSGGGSLSNIQHFVNKQNFESPTTFLLATVDSSNLATAYTYNFNSTSGTAVAEVPLFTSYPIEAETLKATTMISDENENYYFVAKVLTELPSTYKWQLSVFFTSISGSNITRIISEDALDTNDSHEVLTDSRIKDISIQNYAISGGVDTIEARLLINSIYDTETEDEETTGSNLYAVRFKQYVNDSGNYYFSCGSCVKINTGTRLLSPNHSLESTVLSTLTIGEEGSTTDENKKEFIFVLAPTDSDSDGYNEPFFWALNMRAESIQSDTLDVTGTIGHRPPLVE